MSSCCPAASSADDLAGEVAASFHADGAIALIDHVDVEAGATDDHVVTASVVRVQARVASGATDHAIGGSEGLDPVAARVAPEHVTPLRVVHAVRAGAARSPIGALPGQHDVPAAAATVAIVTAITLEPVAAVAPDELVVVPRAPQAVVTGSAEQSILAQIPVEHIVPAPTAQQIVPAETLQRVVPLPAADHVSPRGAAKQVGPIGPP